jgi:hypothetical protein
MRRRDAAVDPDAGQLPVGATWAPYFWLLMAPTHVMGRRQLLGTRQGAEAGGQAAA